jgi:hypothetical protein
LILYRRKLHVTSSVSQQLRRLFLFFPAKRLGLDLSRIQPGTIWQSTRNALIPSARKRREKKKEMERQDHPMAFAFDRLTVE